MSATARSLNGFRQRADNRKQQLRRVRPPGYRIKDVLENELHRRVCAGALRLRAVQHGLAANWQALYRNVFGTDPAGKPS
jgi:hypothetical protein